MAGEAATVGLLFILGFISLGVAIISILRFWLVEATLDTGPALGVLVGLLLGSAWAVKSASPLLMLLWIGVMLGGSVFIPWLAENSDARALHRMYEQDIAKFRRSIESGINPAGAWREIGELYLRMNRYDEAIAAFKEAIRMNPHDVEKVRRRLNLAIEYRAGMPNAKTVICEQCGQETPKGKACMHCGAPLDANLFDWLLQAGNLQEIWKPTTALLAAVVAVLTMFSPMPVALKLLIITSCLLAGGFLIWLAVSED